MKALVTIGFIVLVLFAFIPGIMKWVLWGVAALLVIFLFFVAPRDRLK